MKKASIQPTLWFHLHNLLRFGELSAAISLCQIMRHKFSPNDGATESESNIQPPEVQLSLVTMSNNPTWAHVLTTSF